MAKSSFENLKNNILTKKFGGTRNGVADPYTSGYGFLWFEELPEGLPQIIKDTNGNNDGLSNITDIQLILAAACFATNIQGGSLTPITYQGLGGMKWGVPGNFDYANTFSARFHEFSSTPIFNIFHAWFRLIKDYRTGISSVPSTDVFTKENYAGTAIYISLTPNLRLEYSCCFDGVFVTKDPQDIFSNDNETINRVDLEMDFHFDTQWHEPWVTSKAIKIVERLKGADYGAKKVMNLHPFST